MSNGAYKKVVHIHLAGNVSEIEDREEEVSRSEMGVGMGVVVMCGLVGYLLKNIFIYIFPKPFPSS